MYKLTVNLCIGFGGTFVHSVSKLIYFDHLNTSNIALRITHLRNWIWGMFNVGVLVNLELLGSLLFAVIGKGGENITKLQAQTGCRIQIAQECAENNERPCTLTGTPEQIA